MASASASDVKMEPEQPFQFYNELEEGPLNMLKSIRGFIISVPKKDDDGNPIPCKLEESDFVRQCRVAGMQLKVLENVRIPNVKTNPAGVPYVGDVGYSHMFKSWEVWEKLSASPSSLGCLISHVNCWAESYETDKNAWCFVMEEDVTEHENSAYFFGKLMNLMASPHFQKKTDIQLVHLVYDRESHLNTSLLMQQHSLMREEHLHLLRAPKDAHGQERHTMVGHGARAYLISPSLMRHFLDHSFKWSTWIDMEVNRD